MIDNESNLAYTTRINNGDRDTYKSFYINGKKKYVIYEMIMLLPQIWEALTQLSEAENLDVVPYLKKLCLDKYKQFKLNQ